MLTPIRSLALAVLALPLLVGTAHADPSCVLQPDSHRLEVNGDPAFSGFTLATVPQASGPAAITLTGLGPVGAIPIDCDGATVANVDLIDVAGEGEGLEIDASQAPFANATGEIDIVVNGFATLDYVAPADRPATITAGSLGGDLDGDGVRDLVVLGASTLEIQGSPLDDTISAHGGGDTGRQLPAAMTFKVDPSTGDDVVLGHAGPDSIDLSQASAGQASGYDGDDTLIGGHAGPYALNAGAGDDTLAAYANATTLNGAAGNDMFWLFAGAHAAGGGGDDMFLAQNGQVDVIRGGSGDDTAFVDPSGDLVKGVETVNAGS
jgi:Ca2+-binding RTX toxin-like protein